MAIYQIKQLQERVLHLTSTVSEKFLHLTQSMSSLRAPDAHPFPTIRNHYPNKQASNSRKISSHNNYTSSHPRQFSPWPMVSLPSTTGKNRDRNWESRPVPLSTQINYKPCASCNGFGHFRRDWPNRNDQCQFCGKPKHATAACRKRAQQQLKNPQ